MAELNVSFKGKSFRDLANALNRRVPYKINELLNEVLARVLMSIEMKAKQYVPVRTGHLLSTIQTVTYADKVGAVIATADYAGFVEYGTWKMRAQPYLRPALFNSIPEINALLRLVLPEKLKEGLR